MYKKDQILLCIKPYYNKNSDLILESNTEYCVESVWFSVNQRRFIKNINIKLSSVKDFGYSNINGNRRYRYSVDLLLPKEKLKEHLLTKQEIREYKIKKLNDI